MRVMIMSDMEGVSGIVAWEQVNGGAAMYEEGRRLYTEEINAAVLIPRSFPFGDPQRSSGSIFRSRNLASTVRLSSCEVMARPA